MGGRYKITQLAVYTIISYQVAYYLVVAYMLMGLAIINRGYLIYIEYRVSRKLSHISSKTNN